MRSLLLLLPFYLFPYFSSAQHSITATIIDSVTKTPIPYVTIGTGIGSGIISNEEGQFDIEVPILSDALQLSSMGYEDRTIPIKNLDRIIYLTPKSFELATVFVSDKNLPAGEIIEKVQEHLSKNHLHSYTKKRFFHRTSFTQKYAKMDFGFQKSSIKTIDKRLIDSIAQQFPKHASYFFETLCESYGNHKPEFKLAILRALKLENTSQATTFTEFQEKMEQLLKENVRPDSYLKIKSGILGTKVPLDSIIENQKVKDDRKRHYETKAYFNYRKENIHEILDQLFYHKKSIINIIQNSGRYNFELKEYQEIGDHLTYVLNFYPKKRADFKGTIYINTEDFAVLRLDFKNAKPVYDKLFNMFGINANKTHYQGTMLFEKNTDGYYHIKYANQELGESFAIDRPLRIIEKNKFVRGRRKQNEVRLALDLKMHHTIKQELMVYESTPITTDAFEKYQEQTTVQLHKAASYDPEFWKGYTIITPNQMIREYHAVGIE